MIPAVASLTQFMSKYFFHLNRVKILYGSSRYKKLFLLKIIIGFRPRVNLKITVFLHIITGKCLYAKLKLYDSGGLKLITKVYIRWL